MWCGYLSKFTAGSSMRTSPFCDLPSLSSRFVICNRQDTPYDSEADICFHDNIDNFMLRIFDHLCKFTLHRAGQTQRTTQISHFGVFVLLTSIFHNVQILVNLGKKLTLVHCIYCQLLFLLLSSFKHYLNIRFNVSFYLK